MKREKRLCLLAAALCTLAPACTGEEHAPLHVDDESSLSLVGRGATDWDELLAEGSAASAPYADDVVGAKLRVPTDWQVVPDPYLWETYGFVVAEPHLEDGVVHGLSAVIRVAIDYDAAPGDIEGIIEQKRADLSEVELTRGTYVVDGVEAQTVGHIPGAQLTTNLYFAKDDLVYRVTYYGDRIDERGAALLSTLSFSPPRESVESLELLPADSPEALFGGPAPVDSPPRTAEDLDVALPDDALLDDDEPELLGAMAGEKLLNNGCWTQPTGFFIQIAHSRDANGSGWSKMGTPNFWGDNTHGNWGMGRCKSGYYTNDLYAIDYYLRVGDRLYSPFRSGRVTYAGWDPEGWWNYGKMVVIRSTNGKHVSLSAHLNFVNVRAGQAVNDNTLIGWGGSTGYAAPYPHLHQVYYRYPAFNRGKPYGGRGVKPTALRYLGNGGGVYRQFFKGKWASW